MDSILQKHQVQCIKCKVIYLQENVNDECICDYCTRIIRHQIYDSLSDKSKTLLDLMGTMFEKYIIWY